MNSTIPSETRPNLELTRWIVNRWFVKNGGKEVSAKEKTLNSEHHCVLQKAWVIKYYGLLTNPLAAVIYINEKWFCRTNRRRKIKLLKLGPKEKKEKMKMK